MTAKNEKIAHPQRSAEDDFEVLFKVQGESYSLFIPMETIKSKSKQDIVQAFRDAFTCSICCSQKASFALCMARCVEGDGKCCDGGATNCD